MAEFNLEPGSIESDEGVAARLMSVTVLGIDEENVIVDRGMGQHGLVPKRELRIGMTPIEVSVGDIIDVVDCSTGEGSSGPVRVSWEYARYLQIGSCLREWMVDKDVVYGAILDEEENGYAGNIDGVRVFIPVAHVSMAPLDESGVTWLRSKEQPFVIVAIYHSDDLGRDVVVASRREAISQRGLSKFRAAGGELKVGDTVLGRVIGILPYGCYIRFSVLNGGMNLEGFLHIEDTGWENVGHPSEILSIGDEIEAVVINVIWEDLEVSLGLRSEGELEGSGSD